MAGHHRFYYYLTGDEMTGDAMTDAKDADQSMLNVPFYMRDPDKPLSAITSLTLVSDTPHFRSGPDWSSFVSNWMTHYERTLDRAYLAKIETGIADLAAMPLGLMEGPLTYDPSTGHIARARGDDPGSGHLAICQGGPQVWFEAAELLEGEGGALLKKMLAQFGEFYYMSEDERNAAAEAAGGVMGKRGFGIPYFAAAMACYAYQYYKRHNALNRQREQLPLQAWNYIVEAMHWGGVRSGIEERVYATRTDPSCPEGKPLTEIPYMSTNFAAQWCLNVIMCLEFAPDVVRELSVIPH
jgi:hypothetical protein